MSMCGFCGRPVSHIGACGECYAAEQLKRHWASMGRALGSVPEHYRWARWGCDELYRRCPSLVTLANDDESPVNPATLLSTKILVIHGESGAGKTSLATALFHWIIYSTSPDSSESIIERAKQARFIDACDLAPNPNHEGIPVMVAARRASVLLLDDAGSEGGSGDSFKAKERFLDVAELLRYRDKHDMTTIVTTPGTRGPNADQELAQRWTAMYGGGIMRRYLDTDDTRVVYLERDRAAR